MTLTRTKTLDIKKLDFRDLPLSKLFCDYIQNNEAISGYFAQSHTYTNLKKAVDSYHGRHNRAEAARVIAEFNKPFLEVQGVDELADTLAREDTVTITTGQQLSLFGGPLYTVFKTISTIQLARSLSRDTGKNVIPVFWLADEDHDFDEIAVLSIPAGNEIRRITLPCDTCARHAAGKIRVDKAFDDFRSEVYETLHRTDFHPQLTALLDEAYAPDRSYREAFATLLSRLFSHHGLIFAGSNHAPAKKLASESIRKAIANADIIRKTLIGQSDRIARQYHQQVQVTDSLLFWHDDEQGRVRLRHENDRWETDSGLSVTTGELLDLLEREPERFSPNVFLRPLIQDHLLPNAAYVGGPAEIAYYGQMKPLYELFGMEMPFIAARMSATLAEPAVQRFLDELPFGFTDFNKRLEDLEQHFLRTHGHPELDDLFEKWANRVEALTGEMTSEIGMDDPGLQKHAFSITREHVKSIEKLKKKMLNAIRQKEDVHVNRIRKAKHSLFPSDRLQEREIAFIYYMNKFGMDIWDRLLEQLDEEGANLFDSHYLIHFK
jgi:bacillithiol synthase